MNTIKKITGTIQGEPTHCSCDMDNGLDPCTIVIFGASGDLASRKLIPALYQMFLTCNMPKPVAIVGCARSEMSDQEFRNKQQSWLQEAGADMKCWADFAKFLFYRSITYDDASFKSLADYLVEIDTKHATKANRIFDLAVPPSLYEVIGSLLGRSGLAVQNREGNGWSRIVVEKPFGRDLESCLRLNKTLRKYFKEKQIFRIDHYLAKETVQNVLAFRFANSIFEPLWNRRYISYVGIIAAEKLGVEHRAGYYEQSGIMRDMFQNHMMQLLALTAMEPPSQFEADRVRDEKVKVFRSLRPLNPDPSDDLILGQYTSGSLGDTVVPGYRQERDVSKSSITPTFGLLRLFIDNWRWQGVPFYMVSGKRLPSKVTKLVIQFKDAPHSMFRDIISETFTANRLEIGIYPNESISLTFQTKQPGKQISLQPMLMDFHYQDHYKGARLDAYEKVLLDAILGDHTLFWRQDGIEQTWKILEPTLHEADLVANRGDNLCFYEAGTWGPDAAQETMKKILPEDFFKSAKENR